MFPLKDDIPSNSFPAVNISLIIINCLVFLYEFKLGPDFEPFIMQMGFIPARFMEQQSRDWLDLSRFVPVFSSMFLHGSPMHLISNMWMLWIFGDNVEDCMGHGRYLVFFLLCGIISIFGQAVAWPASQIPMVGASGAISGVLGAYFITYPRARVLTLIPIFIIFYTFELPAFFFLGFWFFIQFLQGSASLVAAGEQTGGGVAWWAHIGGFAAGVVLINFFRSKDWRRTVIRRPIRMKKLKKNNW